MNNTDKIQAVINTLESMEIRSTYDNMNRMLGVYQTLAQVRDELAAEEEKDGGEADAE